MPLGLSVLLWNISTINISSSFGRLDISAYASLNNAVYIILIPTEAYTKMRSQVHVIFLPFLGYIACKSITDSINEGFLRPVLDNAFLFLVEFPALPCTIVVFYVLSISLLDGFWYLFGLELFRMLLVCVREADWIRKGLPNAAKMQDDLENPYPWQTTRTRTLNKPANDLLNTKGD